MDKLTQINSWRQHIKFTPKSVVIFGSYARNDYNEDSDIDILLVHPEYYPTVQIDKLSISTYSTEKLIEFAKNGSLFILHLIKEGKLLNGHPIIETLSKEFKMPDFRILSKELVQSSKLINIDERVFQKYSIKIIGVQKFVLRSIIYMKGIENGADTFNIYKVLEHISLEELNYIFDRTFQKNMKFNQFQSINKIIASLLEITFEKEFLSIEAIILNNHPKKNLLHTLGMSILKKDSVGIDYPKLIFDGGR